MSNRQENRRFIRSLWISLVLVPAFQACNRRQAAESSVSLGYEHIEEAGPHFRITFFNNGTHGWYEGLRGCGVPGAQLLHPQMETIRDLIRSFREIDFFSIPRVPKSSPDSWRITLTYRDDLRIHEVVDYRGDNPNLVRLQERMRKAVDIERFLDPTVEVYRQLVASGWDVDTPDEDRQTALTFASRKQDLESVRFLLQHGATVTEGSLEDAASGKNPGIFFSLAAEAKGGLKPPQRLKLLIAAAQGNIDVTRRLLKEGADLNAHDRVGWTPLIAAAYRGNADMARLLIEAGADVNLRYQAGEQARTPLMFAVDGGSLACTRLLLEKGANPNLKDNAGRTALSRAAWQGNTGFITLLADHGADLNARAKWGRTALMEAASLCNEWNVRTLLAAGADPAIADDKGKTALQEISSTDKDPKCARCRQLLEQALRKSPWPD